MLKKSMPYSNCRPGLYNIHDTHIGITWEENERDAVFVIHAGGRNAVSIQQ